MLYLKQQLLVNSGTLPDDIDKQDYFELLEMMKARPRDERPVDPAVAFKKMKRIENA